jgi:hypothetical protein
LDRLSRYSLHLGINPAEDKGGKKMRQQLFGGAWAFDSSCADLHPMALVFQEDLLFTAWCYEAYPTLVVSHGSEGVSFHS